MTPLTAKPEPSAIDDSDPTQSEPSAPVEAANSPRKVPASRKRAASLELRMANRRAAPVTAEGDAPATAPKTTSRSRSGSGTATRFGPKVQQQRAARAALAKAATEAALADAVLAEAPAPDIDTTATPAPLVPQAKAPEPAVAAEAVATQAPVLEQTDAPEPAPPAVPDPVAETGTHLEIVPVGDTPEGDGTPILPTTPRRRLTPAARRRAAAAAEVKNNDAAHYVVAPTVNMAQMRPRHYGVAALFALMVLLPTLSYSMYLWTKAADQYESNVGFGSRTEETASTFDFLGALGGVSQNGSKDMDILYQFIVSQELVAKVDRELDLKAIYSKAKEDPLNAFRQGGTIEDLVSYWQRMVKVNYDNGTGLMTLRVFAFDPVDAQKIAEMILVESTKIINDLSMTAQEDTTRYSKEALTAAEAKLTAARLAVLDFQVKNRIVDPTNSIATQNSIIGNLNQQLATAQIEMDMLTGSVGPDDLRIATLKRRVEVIENRIAIEQAKVGGATDSTSPGFAKLMQEFERLKVDQDFSERAYLAALAAYDQAITDAQHKTRYLASYVAPTLAEAPTAPNRPLTALIVAVFGFLSWSISVLMYYALRDRR